MIRVDKEECVFEGDPITLSGELSNIIGRYFMLMEEEFGEKLTKMMFEATLKTAMNIKERMGEENGEDET